MARALRGGTVAALCAWSACLGGAACAERAWYPLDRDPEGSVIVERLPSGIKLRTLAGGPIELEAHPRALEVLGYARPLAELDLALDDGEVVLAKGEADTRSLPLPDLWLTVPPDDQPQARALDGFAAAFSDVRVRAASCGTLSEVARLVIPSVRGVQFLVRASDEVVFTESYTATGSTSWPTLLRVTPEGYASVPAIATSSVTRELFVTARPGGGVLVLVGRQHVLNYSEIHDDGHLLHTATGSTRIHLARWGAATVDGELVILVTDRDSAVWRLDPDSGALTAVRGPHRDVRCEDEPALQPLFVDETGRIVYGRSGEAIAVGALADGLDTLAPLVSDALRFACRGSYSAGPEGYEAVWIEEPRAGFGPPPSLVWWHTPVSPVWHTTPVVAGQGLQISFVGTRVAVPNVESVELWAHTPETDGPRLCDRRSLGGTTRKVVGTGPRRLAATTSRESNSGDHRDVIVTWLDVQ